MGFLRNTIALAFVATLLFYFATVGEMQENQQWIVIGVMVVLGLVFILSGTPDFELPAQPIVESKTVEAASASSSEEVSENDAETTPSEPTKTMSLKERKAAKILAAQQAQQAAMAAPIGVAARPNRGGGSYHMEPDSVAGGPTGPWRACGDA